MASRSGNSMDSRPARRTGQARENDHGSVPALAELARSGAQIRLRCARLLPVCCRKWTNGAEHDASGDRGRKNRRPVDLRFPWEWS